MLVGSVAASLEQRECRAQRKKKRPKRHQSLCPSKPFGLLLHNEPETRGQRNMDLSPVDNNILDEFNARLLVRGR